MIQKRGARWRVVVQGRRDELTGKRNQLSGSAETEREIRASGRIMLAEDQQPQMWESIDNDPGGFGDALKDLGDLFMDNLGWVGVGISCALYGAAAATATAGTAGVGVIAWGAAGAGCQASIGIEIANRRSRNNAVGRGGVIVDCGVGAVHTPLFPEPLGALKMGLECLGGAQVQAVDEVRNG